MHEHGAALVRPSIEDLIVLYEPDAVRHAARVRKMRAAGYAPVRSNNPYWDHFGSTFEDHDGYRTELAHLAWPPARPHAVEPAP